MTLSEQSRIKAVPASSADEAEEFRRLQFLQSLGILDAPREGSIDAVTQAAARYFDAPMALVTLIDSERQVIKSSVGFDADQTERRQSFCHFTIQSDRLFIVEDALETREFRNNPFVTDEPGIRFYAGAPLIIGGKYRIGGFCILDSVPRQLSESGQQHLFNFALVTSQLIEELYMSAAGAPAGRPAPPPLRRI